VDNIREILSVPGIDVAFVGATDLAASMGYRKEGSGHADVQKALDYCLEVGEEMGKPVGLPVGNSKAAIAGIERGASYIGLVGNAIIRNAFCDTLNELKK